MKNVCLLLVLAADVVNNETLLLEVFISPVPLEVKLDILTDCPWFESVRGDPVLCVNWV